MEELDRRRGRGWPGALGLFAVVLLFANSSPAVLVAIPYLSLTLVEPSRRLPALAALVLAALLVFGGGPQPGVWYLERGWAVLVGGWFIALTLRWPGIGFFHRAMAAVTGSFAVAALLFAVRREGWRIADWLMTDRIEGSADAALSLLVLVRGEAAVSPELVRAIEGFAQLQGLVFPALLGLTSLSALAVASWLHRRFTWGDSGGLGGLRHFRFNDQLVWVFLAGISVLLLASSDVWERTGANAVVFMGALYALRGAAVLIFLKGGVSVLGSILIALGLLFLGPVLLLGALVVGLVDTWLDFRARSEASG